MYYTQLFGGGKLNFKEFIVIKKETPKGHTNAYMQTHISWSQKHFPKAK